MTITPHVLVPLPKALQVEAPPTLNVAPTVLRALAWNAWERLLPGRALPSGRRVELDATTDYSQGLRGSTTRADVLVLANVHSSPSEHPPRRSLHQVVLVGWLSAELWGSQARAPQIKGRPREVPRGFLKSMGSLLRLESTAGAEFATLVVCPWCGGAYLPMFGPGVRGRRACGTEACGAAEGVYTAALRRAGPAPIATCEPPPDMRDEADATNGLRGPEGD